MTDPAKSNPRALAEAHRKLIRLAEAVLEFSDDNLMRKEVAERCGYGLEFLANLDGISRLAGDYLEQLEPAEEDLPQ